MIALAPTDGDWFNYLRNHPEIKTVNFWTPTDWKISSLSKGDYWYFVLKGSLPRKIGGGGRFVDYLTMKASKAWELYGVGNGAKHYTDMLSRLNGFIASRASASVPSLDPSIGCIILDNCIFLENSRQRTPEDFGLSFPAQVVKYKTFDRNLLELSEDIGTATSSSIKNALLGIAVEIDNNGGFSPHDIEDARNRVLASIVRRQGQPAFRQALLSAYAGRCAVTACDTLDVLEAAHIVPYMGEKTNLVENGILLRADIHTLFDIGLLVIASKDYRIILHPTLRTGFYSGLHGKQIALPTNKNAWPSCEALNAHRSKYGF